MLVLTPFQTHQDGASLIHTTPTRLPILRSLLLSSILPLPPTNPPSLRLLSTLSKDLRPNVVDRDAVLVPAGWDSWGKIGVLDEGFETGRQSRLGWKELKAEFAGRVREKRGVESVGFHTAFASITIGFS